MKEPGQIAYEARHKEAFGVDAHPVAWSEEPDRMKKVWTAAYGTWAEFGASEHEGGEAAIKCLLSVIRERVGGENV